MFCAGGLVLDPEVFASLRGQACSLVDQFHGAHPMRRGMPQEELRRRLPRVLRPTVYHHLLEDLTVNGALQALDGLVRRAGYSPESALSAVERAIAQDIEAEFRAGGLKPPDLDTVLKRDRRRKSLYHFLVEAGALVPTTERTSNRTVVFHRDALTEAERLLSDALVGGEGQTVSQLNAASGDDAQVLDSSAGTPGQPGRDEARGRPATLEREGVMDTMADKTNTDKELRLTERSSSAG